MFTFILLLIAMCTHTHTYIYIYIHTHMYIILIHTKEYTRYLKQIKEEEDYLFRMPAKLKDH